MWMKRPDRSLKNLALIKTHNLKLAENEHQEEINNGNGNDDNMVTRLFIISIIVIIFITHEVGIICLSTKNHLLVAEVGNKATMMMMMT